MKKYKMAMRFLVWAINRTREVKDLIEGWDRTLLFDLDGEDFFYLRFGKGKASFHNGRPEKADVTMKIPANVLMKVMTGQKDMDEAYAEKRYDIIGPIVDGIRFRRITAVTEESNRTLFHFLRKLSSII